MLFSRISVVLAVIAIASANPLEEMRSLCAGDDTVACIKYKLASFLDSLTQKSSFKPFEDVEVVQNQFRTIKEITARGQQSFEDNIKEYFETHDMTVKLPIGESVTVSGRDLDNNQLNFKLKFSSNVEEGRKKKLKKIVLPIVILLLLKALTLIPLLLGVLGIKTWNAIQLSFITFMTSFGMAVYELCKKFASDHAHPTIVHDHWDAHHRSFSDDDDDDVQQLAYKGYY